MLNANDEQAGGKSEAYWRWLVVGVIVVLVTGAMARLAERRADVRLSFRAGEGRPVVRLLTSNGRVVPLEIADDACYRRLIITTTGPGRISMTPPFTSQGGRLVDLSQFSCTAGDWQVVGDWTGSAGWRGGEWAATTPGSVLQWSGHAGSFELEFKADSPGGGVEVVADGVALPQIALDGGGGATRAPVLTRQLLATGMVPASEFPATIELSAHTEAMSVAIVSDGRTVYSSDLPTDSGTVHIPVIPYPSNGTYARRTAALVGRATCVNGLFFLLGAPFCATLFNSRSLVIAVAASWAAGMSLTILLATSLTYVIPGAAATIIGVVTVMTAGVVSSRNSKVDVRRTVARVAGVRWLCVLLALGFAGALFAFSPIITEDGWFLGQSLTDSMDYIAWSERLIGVPLKDAGIAPWRIADLQALVAISTLTGVNAREGYALVAFTFFVMLPLLTHAILEVLDTTEAVAACGAAIAAALSVYPQLFDFSFFAQYMNGFVLHAGILSACLLIDRTHAIPVGRWWPTHCALAGPLALGVAMYPYQAIPAFVLFVWLFAAWARQRSRYTAALLGTQLVLATALTNRSLGIGIDFFQSKLSTLTFLDALARNIVFPFHASWKFLCIVAGCRDITMAHTYLQSLAPSTSTYSWWQSLYCSDVVMAVVVAGFSALVVVGLFWLLRHRTGPETYTFAVYAAFASVAVVLFATNHTYSYGKFLLTFGMLVAVPAAIGLVLLTRGARFGFCVGSVFLGLFIFFNMCSTVVDQSLLGVSRASPLLFNRRTHLAAIDVGVRDLDRWSETMPYGFRVGVIGNYARAAHADTDRVLYNRILHSLRNADVMFEGRVCPIHTPAFVFGSVSDTVDFCQYDYVLVFRGYEHLCEPLAKQPLQVTEVLSNSVFRVFRSLKGSAECFVRASHAL